MFRLLAPPVLLALAPALATAQGTIHVVDSLGGVGAAFSDIQPAVDAAADGDTILIRPGIYTGFTVDGKDLDLVGDVDASTSAKVLTGRTVIKNVPASEQVTLSDLRLSEGLDVHDAEGPVVLQGLLVGGIFVGDVSIQGPVGLDVQRCDELLIGRSYVGGFIAPGGAPATLDGPKAMRVEQSTVYAWDTSIYGGKGATGVEASFTPPGAGGAGLELVGATLRGDQLTVTGGAGGDGWSGVTCSGGGPGGTGLVLIGTSSLSELRASSLSPGPGGLAGVGSGGACAPGFVGTTTQLVGGKLTQQVGEDRAYTVSPVAREGETFPVIVSGTSSAAGAVGIWLVADKPSTLPQILAEGALVSATPSHISVLGVAGPTGGLVKTFTVPELGPGVQALTLVSQAALFTTAGELRLTEPEATLLLDSAF